MDETIKKDVIARAMTEMECYTECYPVIREDVAIQEYTKVPLGQLSAMGVTFASVAPVFQKVVRVDFHFHLNDIFLHKN